MRFLVLLLILFAFPATAQISVGDQNSSAAADVEANAGTSRNELNVNTGTAPTTAGYARMADDLGRAASIVGTDDFRALMTCSIRPAISSQLEGAALDARVVNWTNTTMTQTQTAGAILFNAGAATASGNVTRLTTHKTVPFFEGQAALYTFTFKRPTGQTGQSNEVIEIGPANSSGTTPPTDGVFFRWNASGEFRAVSVFNSTESQSAVLTSPTANVAHLGMIARRSDGTDFWIDGIKVASIEEATQMNTVSVRGLPFTVRVYNSGVPVTAPQITLGPWSISRCGDMDKPWGSLMATMGAGSHQAPLTAFAQTANHANSTSPVSATLSNTTASYTTLGGRYQFAAIAGVATDFALFGYQVPTGYQLHVTGVGINACNTGAAVATTATMLDWSVGVQSTAVSLATADSFPAAGPIVMGPRRIPLGSQGFIIGAAIGACASDIVRTFDPPLVVDSGRFLHVIMQQPVGTATAAQIIRGDVHVQGYFE